MPDQLMTRLHSTRELDADRDACEDASAFSSVRNVACRAPATVYVHHADPHKRAYRMCAACADSNVNDRGGRIIASIHLPKKLAPDDGATVR